MTQLVARIQNATLFSIHTGKIIEAIIRSLIHIAALYVGIAIVGAASAIDYQMKLWTCPFCLMRNHFPPNYAESISETQLPAELIPRFTTVEYQLQRTKVRAAACDDVENSQELSLLELQCFSLWLTPLYPRRSWIS